MSEVVTVEIEAKTDKAEANLNDVVDVLKDIKSELAENKKAIEKNAESTKELESNFKKVARGVKGFGLALKAAGIGLAVEAFNFLKDSIESNQRFADGLNKAFEVMKGVVAVLLNTLEPLIDVFTNVGRAVKAIVTGEFTELSNIGSNLIDNFKQLRTNIINVGQNFSDTVKNISDYADEIVELRKETELANAEAELQLFIYQTQAERLRQLRDDTRKSIEDRIEANQELKRVLDEQFSVELRLRQRNLQLAERELKENKGNVEAIKNVIDAKKELADLEERIEGLRSEQLTNEASLEQEQEENYKNEQLRLIELADKEFEIFQANNNRKIFSKEKTEKIIQQLDKKTTEEFEKESNKRKQIDLSLAQDGLSIASSAVGQLISLNASKTVFDDKAAEQQFKNQKKLQLLNTTINTASGIVSAFTPYVPVLSEVRAGIVAATGAAQAAIINKQKYQSSGGINVPRLNTSSPNFGGGADGFNPSTQTISAIPQFTNTTTGNAQTGVRAYVIQNDITNQQALAKRLDQRATL